MSEKNENVEQEVTEEIKKINEEKSELQKKQQELDDLTDRYKRILAEFENHKKRSQTSRKQNQQKKCICKNFFCIVCTFRIFFRFSKLNGSQRSSSVSCKSTKSAD